MFAFTRRLQSRRHVARACKPAILLLLAGLLAACATDPTTTAQRADATRLADAATVEMEDDGLPVQAPPPARAAGNVDDPQEPFSPNYGGANPSAGLSERSPGTLPPPAPAQGTKPVIPEDLPPAFRRQLAAALSDTN